MKGDFRTKKVVKVKEKEKEFEKERNWRREFAFKSLDYRNLKKERFILDYKGIKKEFSSSRSCFYLELLLQQLMNKRILNSYNTWVKKVRELNDNKELSIKEIKENLKVEIKK